MITTLLDNDFYAFTMAHCLWMHGHHDLNVRYAFRNRTFSVPLARRLDLDLLAKHISEAQQLTFRAEELAYLDSLHIFNHGFLTWLEDVVLPDVQISSDSGHLVMTYEGAWGHAIFWETILLSIVNEMYYQRFNATTLEGEQRLREKIDYLAERGTLHFVEFGTRRRFSHDWQHYVGHTMKDEIPNLLLGTSNVALAKDLDIPPVGTMAHQLFMVFAALWTREAHPAAYANPLTFATNQVLSEWRHVYRDHPNMMVALPDTYTTDAFIAKTASSALEGFTAFRQDSGDPLEVGQQLVGLAKCLHIPPKIIFSDALDIRRMSIIEDYFPEIETIFGWGTDLTNDLGYQPLSIVIKPSAVQFENEWVPCVKISDDIQKATGEGIATYLQLAKVR